VREVLTRRIWVTIGAIALLTLVLVDVTIVEPRIHIRWREGITALDRAALEQRYALAAGEPLEGNTWRYALGDGSRENVAALIADRAVADTAYIDRPTLAVPARELRIGVTRARLLLGPAPLQVVQLQSVLLFAAAATMLWAAAVPDVRRRRRLAGAVLLGVALAAYALPLRQPIRMGDSETYTRSRESFELFSGVHRIRAEAHLSHTILGRLDSLFGRTEAAPGRAMTVVMHGATAWFLLTALTVAVVERWSPVVVRYVGLVLLAPSTLLYFGYRELGHLSLNAAAFPLLVRGLQQGTAHLEAGSTLIGVGAALHGFGLLSLFGAWFAALATRISLAQRVRLLGRVVAWGTAAYLGWVAVYLILLKLPLVPGHAESIPLRPWFAAEIGDRINAAIFSATGARDLVVSAWLAGVPLVAVVASLWRTHANEVRLAAAYSMPSAVFLVVFWPIQGLAVEMDLVFAAFPALFALAWVCAHDARKAAVAAVLLASAQLMFWRVVLDHTFVNSRI
jgi:hypothetical protein